MSKFDGCMCLLSTIRKMIFKHLLYLALIVSAVAGRINQCTTVYYKTITTSQIAVIPSSMSPEQDIQLSFTIKNKNNTINAGFIHYTIIVDDEEYMPQVDDLCSSIKCPLQVGNNDIVLKFKMPNYLKPIAIYVELMDYAANTFTCFKIKTPNSFWSWLKSIVSSTPIEPIANVRKMLRGTPDYEELEHNVIHSSIQPLNEEIKPTVGMRPSVSSQLNITGNSTT